MPSIPSPDNACKKDIRETMNMRGISAKKLAVLLLTLSALWDFTVYARVRVRVMNRLGCGKIMNIHCQSRDDDLGYLVIPDGYETDWAFSVNFWGTTLFYCDVQWDNQQWHHFVAFSYERDAEKCQTECIWVVARDGHMYNYNQLSGNWDMVPFHDPQG